MTDPAQPILSICTPTYNRSALLGQLLEALCRELPEHLADQVEIVVSDNASTDDTPVLLEQYRARFSRMVTVRHEQNLGFDRNMLAAVAAASGRYCWLMGDDDLPQPGAIQRILAILDEYPDLCGMTIDRAGRSFDLKVELPENPLGQIPETLLLQGAEEVFRKVGYYIAYMSAQVIHRDTWMAVTRSCPIGEFCNAYIHVYMMGAMLQRRTPWLVLKERLVVWRADNDSALTQGYYRRIEIDVVGFEQIARSLFGSDSPTYRFIRDMMAAGALRYGVTKARLAGAWKYDAAKTRKLALKYYARSARFWLLTAPFVFAPNGINPLLRAGQRLVHRRRAQRIGISS